MKHPKAVKQEGELTFSHDSKEIILRKYLNFQNYAIMD